MFSIKVQLRLYSQIVRMFYGSGGDSSPGSHCRRVFEGLD